MSNPSNGLRFDVYERVHLADDVAAIDELEEIELVPRIQIVQQDDQVMLKGHLLLTGIYRGQGEERSEQLLEHRIPVEITLPMNRVGRLDDISVEIDNFDVDLLSARTINVTGVLSLLGIEVDQPADQEEWQREEPFTVVHKREPEEQEAFASGWNFTPPQPEARGNGNGNGGFPSFEGWVAPQTQGFREALQREAAQREAAERERVFRQQEEAERQARAQEAAERQAGESEAAARAAEREAEALELERRQQEAAEREAEAQAEAFARAEAEREAFARAEAEREASAQAEAEREAFARAEVEREAFAQAEAEREAFARAEAEREASAQAEAEREAFARAEAEREAFARAEAEREAFARAEAEREAFAEAEREPAPYEPSFAADRPEREPAGEEDGIRTGAAPVQAFEQEAQEEPQSFNWQTGQTAGGPSAPFDGSEDLSAADPGRQEMKIALGSKPSEDPSSSASNVNFRSLLQSSRREQEAKAAAEQSAQKEAESQAEKAPEDEIEWKNLFFSRSSEEQFKRLRLCIVQREETLDSIASRYQLQARELALYNRLADQSVSEGQVLYIP